MIKRLVKKEAVRKNYRELEKEAAELKKEPEIKRAICQTISGLERKEILTEIKFVKLLTNSVSNTELVKKYVIPPNAVLYAIIAFQIFQSGLEKYCDEQKS